jgi:hypothetical protein
VSSAAPAPSVRPPLHRDRWLWVLVGVLVLAIPLLVHQGRAQSFYLDEFDFIVDRRLRSPSTLFAPWYGHWVTLPAVAYRLLLAVFGLRTYLPYQLLSIAGHFAVVLAAWATARRLGARSWIATAAVVPLVVLGSGRPNILFGFQVTLTAALALGMLQLLLAVHDGPWSRRDTAGVVCGLVALMCSGVAVATAIGVGAAVLLHRGWRIAAGHTAPLGVAFLAWWLLAPDGHSDPDPTFGADVFRFAVRMGRNAFEGVGGSTWAALGIAWLVLIGIAATVQAARADRARLDRAAVLLGLVTTGAVFAVTSGVTRAVMHGPDGALEQRYVHILAALGLPVAAAGIERLARSSTWWTLPAFGVLALGVPGNVRALAEDVPPNTIAAYARSEQLASADGDRVLHPLVPIPVSLLQDAARNPSEWADVEISPAEQLQADLFLTLGQRDRPGGVGGCEVLASTSLRTEAGEPIDFVGEVDIVATDGAVSVGPIPYAERDGGALVPSGSLDLTIAGRSPGSGVLDC